MARKPVADRICQPNPVVRAHECCDPPPKRDPDDDAGLCPTMELYPVALFTIRGPEKRTRSLFVRLTPAELEAVQWCRRQVEGRQGGSLSLQDIARQGIARMYEDLKGPRRSRRSRGEPR